MGAAVDGGAVGVGLGAGDADPDGGALGDGGTEGDGPPVVVVTADGVEQANARTMAAVAARCRVVIRVTLSAANDATASLERWAGTASPAMA